LDLGVRELAKIAQVGSTTITRFEKKQGGTIVSTVKALQQTLEERGIVFLHPERGIHGGGVAIREGFEAGD
jgi:predicted transcriptional regulator